MTVTVTSAAALRPLAGVGAGLAERWRQLADQAIEPNPFAGPDLVLAAAKHLPDGNSAALLTVERGGELIFALPVLRRAGSRRFPVPTLRSWDHAYNCLNTPLIAPARGVEAWRAVQRALSTRLPLLLIDNMRDDGPVAADLTAALDIGASDSLLHPAYPAVLDSYRRPGARPGDGSGEVSHKTERTLASRRRKLGRLLDGEVRTGYWIGEDRPPEELIDRFLDLEAAGWKGHQGTALASMPGTAAFFRELVRGHAARGALQVLALQVADRLVAATVNLLDQRTVFCFKMAFDEGFQRCSPGRQLVTENLRLFHEHGGLDYLDSCADADTELATHTFNSSHPMARVLISGASAPTELLTRGLLAGRAARRRLHELRADDVPDAERAGQQQRHPDAPATPHDT